MGALASTVLALAFSAAFAALPAAAGAAPLPSTTGEVAQPANSDPTNPYASLDAVACDAPGSCSAVGYYYDGSGGTGNSRPMVAREQLGVWGVATEIAQPANSNNTGGKFSAVACDAPGSCSAVGDYTDDSGNSRTIVAKETGGVWHAATEVAQPVNSDHVRTSLAAVACDAPGSCSAVGYYTYGSGGNQRTMVAQESGGVWGAATEVAQPANHAATLSGKLNAVACDAPGSCSAIGYYNGSGSTQRTMVAQESVGTWTAATELVQPTGSDNADAYFQSIACDAPGSCTAVGGYEVTITNYQAMVAQESGGAWGAPTKVTQPTGSGNTDAGFDTVVCDAPGSCSAIGAYQDASDNEQIMVLQKSGGVWGTATEVAQPANSDHARMWFYGAACDAPGSCTAVGYYDSSKTPHPIALQESGGAWATATEVAQPANSGSTDTRFYAVACDAPGSCTATGHYAAGSGNQRAMATARPTPTPTVTLTANGSANPTLDYGATATLAWTSTDATSCAATGDWSGAQPTAGTASFPDLTQGHYYALSCTGPGDTVSASALVSVRTRCETTPAATGCAPVPPATQITVSTGKNRGSTAATYVLDGRGSTDPNGGTIVAYKWTLHGRVVGRAPTLTRRLAYGRTYTFTLTVTNTAGLASAATVTVKPVRGKPARAKYVTLFPSNRYDLTRSAKQQLRLVAARLHRLGVKRLVVDGYSDSLGTRAYNLALSRLRAETVAAYLKAKLGLAKDKVLVRSCGATHFVAPNTRSGGYDNPAGRARNRRVVVTAYLR